MTSTVHTSAPPQTGPPPKTHKCKFPGCKTSLDRVAQYSDQTGKIKMYLCHGCKNLTSIGAAMVPVDQSSQAFARAAKARVTPHKEAIIPGRCQYPKCKKEDCKRYVTKSVNPVTRQMTGYYCKPHLAIMNSDARALPFRLGRVTEYILESFMYNLPVNVLDTALKYGVTVDNIKHVIMGILPVLNITGQDLATDGKSIHVKRNIKVPEPDTLPDEPEQEPETSGEDITDEPAQA